LAAGKAFLFDPTKAGYIFEQGGGYAKNKNQPGGSQAF